MRISTAHRLWTVGGFFSRLLNRVGYICPLRLPPRCTEENVSRAVRVVVIDPVDRFRSGTRRWRGPLSACRALARGWNTCFFGVFFFFRRGAFLLDYRRRGRCVAVDKSGGRSIPARPGRPRREQNRTGKRKQVKKKLRQTGGRGVYTIVVIPSPRSWRRCHRCLCDFITYVLLRVRANRLNGGRPSESAGSVGEKLRKIVVFVDSKLVSRRYYRFFGLGVRMKLDLFYFRKPLTPETT